MIGKPNFRKPVPPSAVECTGVSGQGLVPLDDGSLMLIGGDNYYISTDGGLNWSASRPPNCQVLSSSKEQSCIRLQSGKLALAHRGREEAGRGTEEFNWNSIY